MGGEYSAKYSNNLRLRPQIIRGIIYGEVERCTLTVILSRFSARFWRLTTPTDGEIDYIEEFANGELKAYEFKWSQQRRVVSTQKFIAVEK